MLRYLICPLALLCISLIPMRPVAAAEKKPNFVFFLVDDLGWADIGNFGSTFHETPHIDALAASGVAFRQAYTACPVCSPTRASIMTGRHPVRVDITDWIPGMRAGKAQNPKFQHIDDRDELALEEVTLAETLKGHGYQTFFAGKWHLGNEGHWPTEQGFDFNIGGNSKGSPPGGYYAPWTNPTLEAKSNGEYLTERLTEESVSFLETRDREKPFLLYLAYYNVHTPITPYKKRVGDFEEKAAQNFDGDTPYIDEHGAKSRARQDNAAYASMVAAVDMSVGTILDKLEEQGIDDNTIVFFFSDNGGLATTRGGGPTCNLPLRSGKGWLYEGGIRVPLIIKAPGMAQGGESQTPCVSMDFFPTMLELAGLPLEPQLHADGQSLAAELTRPGSTGKRTFYWHYPHYHGSTWKPGAAIRDGDWKLIEFYEHDKVELYNLADDPGEQHELSESEPEKLKQLRQKLSTWQRTMRAKMPRPNPEYQAVEQ